MFKGTSLNTLVQLLQGGILVSTLFFGLFATNLECIETSTIVFLTVEVVNPNKL